MSAARIALVLVGDRTVRCGVVDTMLRAVEVTSRQ
jgi:hypothetical protein